MKSRLTVAGITIDVTRKDIKNINLRVYPADGKVAISCPYRTKPAKVIDFATEKISWIKKHLDRGKHYKRSEINKFITGEKHPVWGVEKELRVIHFQNGRQVFLIGNNTLNLCVKTGTQIHHRKKLLQEWYRAELKREIPLLISKWEPVMGVTVNEFGVKRMRTRWGTCNIRDKRIWLNLELAKKDPVCLEFIVVHEMVHLLERLHSKRFYYLMDHFLPDWMEREKLLVL